METFLESLQRIKKIIKERKKYTVGLKRKDMIFWLNFFKIDLMEAQYSVFNYKTKEVFEKKIEKKDDVVTLGTFICKDFNSKKEYQITEKTRKCFKDTHSAKFARKVIRKKILLRIINILIGEEYRKKVGIIIV